MESLYLICCFLILANAHYKANWESIDSRPLPSWFDESKIGIVLHWGLFSVPSFGSEWFWHSLSQQSPEYVKFMKDNYGPNFKYPEFGPMFTAEFYDPVKWTKLFEASGARYVVLSSKHHEGYTLWPSKYSWNWNSLDIGPKRDLVGDLADAVRKNSSMKFGVMYSWREWFHPSYMEDESNYFNTRNFVETKAMPEMYDLVNTYKPDIVWSNGALVAPDGYWNSTGFLAWLYNDSPVKDTVVVNDRWGAGLICRHGGYMSCKNKYRPGAVQPRKWENMIMLDKSSWGYRRNFDLSAVMKIENLISTLVETVSDGGNLLINVGPTHDGRIIPIFEERLRQLGSWLDVNGEAIYNTTPWKDSKDVTTPSVCYTRGNDTIYAIVLKWPADNELHLGSVQTENDVVISMLGVEKELQWKPLDNKGIVVFLPSVTAALLQTPWAWVLKISNYK